MNDGLKRVGYWRADESSQEELPWPSTIRKLSDDIKHLVVLYLTRGTVHEQWKGSSQCRICGKTNGSRCLTDGVFVWPDGYAHYIDAHDVAVDPALMAHILTR